MRWKLKNEIQCPNVRSESFFPSLVDCLTARHLWSLIQNRTGRTKETKLQNDLLTTWEGCIQVSLAAVVLSEFFLLRFCGPGYVRSHFSYLVTNLKQVFFLAKWRLYSLWVKTLNRIKDLVFFVFSLLFYKIYNLKLLS